jgi:ABC-type transport system involved in multi-copper enzyme maturation permease subunit
MAVHSHVFRPYEGPREKAGTRWIVLARYALGDALSQKKTIGLLVMSAFPVLAAAILVYLRHNVEAIKMFEIPLDKIVAIDGVFFYRLLTVQCMLAFALTAATGARVLVADLRDNALPLYLARPLSRFEYVLGKAVAIVVLGSLVTWVPSLLLFGLQASLATGWLRQYWWIAPGIVLGALAAVSLFALVCLAVASVVRKRAAAEAAFVSLFLLVPLVARVVEQILHIKWWVYLFVPALLEALWTPLFRLQQSNGVSPLGAAITLAVALSGAAFVLSRRIRAWEVVR